MICPMIEEGEMNDVENVTDYSKALRKIFPKEISDAVSGIIVYLCAFSMLFKGFFMKLFEGKLFHKKEGGGKK